MGDDRTKRHLDGKRISLTQPHELRYWTRRLGVSGQQLGAAVAAVGRGARKVRDFLAKR